MRSEKELRQRAKAITEILLTVGENLNLRMELDLIRWVLQSSPRKPKKAKARYNNKLDWKDYPEPKKSGKGGRR